MPTTQVKGDGVQTAGGTPPPAGTVAHFAGSSAPSGWLQCDGSAVSRTTFADLFTAIGTTWGVGDGSTTFNLPDLRGRHILGENAGTFDVADADGAEDHQLTSAEMPSHGHNFGSNTATAHMITMTGGAGAFTVLTPSGPTSIAPSSTGSDQAHNNMQPFLALMSIIKT